MMRDKGINQRSADRIADVVPLGWIVSNIKRLERNRSAGPGLYYTSICNDDAGWLQRQQHRAAVAAAPIPITEAKPAAPTVVPFSELAALTDDDFTAALSEAIAAEPAERRTAITRQLHTRGTLRNAISNSLVSAHVERWSAQQDALEVGSDFKNPSQYERGITGEGVFYTAPAAAVA